MFSYFFLEKIVCVVLRVSRDASIRHTKKMLSKKVCAVSCVLCFNNNIIFGTNKMHLSTQWLRLPAVLLLLIRC